ncbi:MAG: hypothetical protein H6747_06730 [Deltaproteobacteria bacterium]|nr:hypothetical protein [Deltaproteobacteria bacterium]
MIANPSRDQRRLAVRTLPLVLALTAITGCGNGGGDSTQPGPDVADAAQDGAIVDVGAIDVQQGVDGKLGDGSGSDTAAETTGGDGGSVDAGPISCAAIGDCKAPVPVCDFAAGVCVACLQDGDCAAGTVCLGKACGAAIACTSDKECIADDAVCDKDAGHCVDCLADGDCTGSGQICKLGHCVAKPPECTSSKDCAVVGGVCDKSSGLCAECTSADDCVDARFCKQGVCVPDVCTAGQTQCNSPTELGGCNAEGSGYESSACKATEACYEGACKPKICAPGEKVCTSDGVKVCNARGVGLGAATPCKADEACKDGACLAKVCTPGETTCKDGVLATCAPEGTAWASSKCKASVPGALGEACGSKDGKAACVPMLCAPKSLVCAGTQPAICDDDGLGNQPSGDCKLLPDGGPGTCAGGVCLPDACTGAATSCAGAAVVGCKDGTWTTSACASGQGCKDGACEKVVCVADEVYCAGTVRLQCDKSGTSPATLQDCAADGKTCKDGACVPTVCKPGSVVCSDDGSATETCNALGLATVKTSCPSQHTCVGGSCLPVICQAGTAFCSGDDAVQCSKNGTSTTTLESCKSGTTCKDGACVKWICTPGASECAGDQLATCDEDGLGKTVADCPSGEICNGLGCKKVVCEALKKGCDGSKAGMCNAKGTGWIGQQDCAATKLYCVEGACSAQVCKPGEKACVGVAVGTCQSDGLGWASKVDCTDNNACTSDGCKDGACLYGQPKVCDDKDACTKDWCDTASGKCLSSGITGPCDDGSLCTSGDTCEGGKCQAGPGHLSTVAGTGSSSFLDGPALSARFDYPEGVAVDKDGTIYVADGQSNRIRVISPTGQVTTLAGNGSSSYSEGVGASARFYRPAGIALAGSTLYVSDTYHHRVRTIDIASKKSALLAGNGSASYQDGPPTTARFRYPAGLTVADDGDVVVADRDNHRIRRISGNGTVSTLAGSGSASFLDGPVATARFKYPYGVAEGAPEVFYVADQGNHRIRRIQGGQVTTVAGQSADGNSDGVGVAARFSSPRGITVTAAGNLIVGDFTNSRIRMITPAGVVSTLAGTSNGFADGDIGTAKLYHPIGVAVEPGGTIVIADYDNHRIRRLTPGTVNCDDGAPCTADACDPKTGACSHTPIAAGKPCDDGDACTLATACDAKGGCLGEAKNCSDNNPCTTDTCDSGTGTCNHAAHDEACDDGDACSLGDACVGGLCKAGVGTITAVAGNGSAAVVDGAVADAKLYSPVDAAERPDGSLAIAGRYNVRLLSADGKTVTTLAGPGVNVSGAATGYGPISRFTDLRALAAWPDGSLRLADSARIIRVGSAGYTTLLAGAANNSTGYVDGKGDTARFNGIRSVARRADGGLVISEESNRRIRLLAPDGMVSTLAGSGQSGYQDGPATSATFSVPRGVAVGGDGAIYVADAGNRRIRKIAGNIVSTVAGSGQSGAQDGAATSATFPDLWGLAAMPGGRLAIATNAALRLYDPANNGAVSTLLTAGSAPFAGFGVALGLHVAKGNLRGVSAGSGDRLWVVDPSHQVRVLRFGTAACDDGSPCTTDACNKAKGCTHTAKAKGSACDDGSKCTATSACDDKGQCAGAAKNCDDGNNCSVDGCDPDLGSCTHDPSLGDCNDGSACTTGEACSGGSCSSQPLVLTTVAGLPSTSGYVDGDAAESRFNYIGGVDATAEGVYAADTSNHVIRLYAGGKVTTLAGTPKTSGFQDGVASSARFSSPQGIAVRADGTIFIADRGNHRIRHLAKDQVATYAGSTSGYVDGPIGSALFAGPHDVLLDNNSRLWVADRNNHRIRRILPAGTVETVAGGNAGFQDGPGTSAMFSSPAAMALSPDGTSVYVVDLGNRRIRKVAPDGSVSTVLGNGASTLDALPTPTGGIGGPTGITFDSAGAMLVSVVDASTRVVLTMSGGKLELYFGELKKQGTLDGIPGAAQTYSPGALDRGPDGSIWLADNAALRAVLSKAKNCDDGSPCTTDACNAKTGACSNTKLATGSACTDGTACTSADACDAAGKCVGKVKDCSDGNVCTADNCDPFDGSCGHPHVDGPCDDGSACTVGEACAEGKCQTGPGMVETIAGDGTSGYADGAALAAKMQAATGLVVRKDGGVVFADTNNHRIRLLAGGQVTTLAGDGQKGYLDGKGAAARLSSPGGMAERADGGIVFFDQQNARIRLLAADGTVSTLAGSGQSGTQDGFPTSASFSVSGSVAQQGDVSWIIDSGNHRIRTVAKDGTVATVAGSSPGFQDGPASSARFSTPTQGAFAGGALYLADYGNHRIRKLAGGIVSTVAGNGSASYQDGPLGSNKLYYPVSITAAADGSIWFGSNQNRRVRRLDGAGVVSTVAGSGSNGSANGFGTAATFSTLNALAWKSGAGAIVGSTYALRLVRAPTKVCDDGLPCTVDACDAKTGACSAPKASDGAACVDDGKPCTEAMTCKAGACQGGKPKSCDDGDVCSKDSCDVVTGGCTHAPDSNAGCTAIRRVFVTSEAFSPNFGGIDGAHSTCEAAAAAAKLGGSWKAWLSTSSTYPNAYFNKSAVPYRLLSGVEIAKNWTDLVDGTLAAAISITELGTPVGTSSTSYCGSSGTPSVWTGTNTSGNRANSSSSIYYCGNWTTTTTSSNYRAYSGNANLANSKWTTNCSTQRCNYKGHLYCFEQSDHLVKQ